MVLGDYHTHSVFSHGRGTIEQVVARAAELGLKEIAITDHGFEHLIFHVKRRKWPFVCKKVADLRLQYPDINIYLGVEANFVSRHGDIDVRPSDEEVLDITLAGFHKGGIPRNPSDIFQFFIPNLWADWIRWSSKKRIAKNTDAYIKGIEKHRIDIIPHLNFAYKVDVLEVAKACAHFGTMLELSGRKIRMSDKEIEDAAATGVNFVMNSDAHHIHRIGNVDAAIEAVKRVGVPWQQVANWDKLPVFRTALAKKNKNNESKL